MTIFASNTFLFFFRVFTTKFNSWFFAVNLLFFYFKFLTRFTYFLCFLTIFSIVSMKSWKFATMIFFKLLVVTRTSNLSKSLICQMKFEISFSSTMFKGLIEKRRCFLFRRCCCEKCFEYSTCELIWKGWFITLIKFLIKFACRNWCRCNNCTSKFTSSFDKKTFFDWSELFFSFDNETDCLTIFRNEKSFDRFDIENNNWIDDSLTWRLSIMTNCRFRIVLKD